MLHKEKQEPAYMISFLRIHDFETHSREYMPYSVPIVEKHGGKPFIISDDVESLEGNLPEGRLVILEFPSKEHAEAFYNDPDYQPLKAIRKKTMESDMAIVERE